MIEATIAIEIPKSVNNKLEDEHQVQEWEARASDTEVICCKSHDGKSCQKLDNASCKAISWTEEDCVNKLPKKSYYPRKNLKKDSSYNCHLISIAQRQAVLMIKVERKRQ